MVETSSGVNSALSKALQESKDRLSQQQDFATAVDVFSKRLLRDLGDSNLEAQTYFRKLLKSMDSATQTFLRKITHSTKEVETNIAGLSQVSRRLLLILQYDTDKTKNVRKSNDDVLDLEKTIGKVFQRVVEGSAELASSQTQHWEVSRSVAVDLQNTLEAMRGHEVDALVQAFGTIRSELAST